MTELSNSMNIDIERLKEREKELECLYQVEQQLADKTRPLEDAFKALLTVIPMGWMHPRFIQVCIICGDIVVESEFFNETELIQKADLVAENNLMGEIKVCYAKTLKSGNIKFFLPEEQKLLNTIAERISAYVFYKKLKVTIDYLKSHKLDELPTDLPELLKPNNDIHWKWRMSMTLNMAQKIELDKFGITSFYLIGSTKDATAGPDSDLDLLVYTNGNEMQIKLLQEFFKGWSFGLSEYNYALTGYRIDKFIDLHLVSDNDNESKARYNSIIDDIDRPAILLKGSRPKG